MSIIRITGFEYGDLVIYPAGGGLLDSITGTPRASSNRSRTGGYSFRVFTSNAEVRGGWDWTGNYEGNATFYVNFESLPITNVSMIAFFVHQGSERPGLYYNPSTHYFEFGTDGGTHQAVATTIQADTWYKIDVKVSVNSTNVLVDGRVNGTAATQASTAATQSTITGFRLGTQYTNNVYTAYYDDVIVENAVTNYPFGNIAVIGIRPSADGTHSNAANYLEDYSSNYIDGTNYFAYSQINENPWDYSLVNCVVQETNDATKYVEVQFEDISPTNIIGAMAVLQYRSAATQGNQGACIIRDSNGQETEVWGNPTTRADYSEESSFFKRALINTPSGGWTKDHVNALRARMGYSNDTNPDPYWVALIIEVAYIATTEYNLTVNNSSHSHSAETKTLVQQHTIIIQNSANSLISEQINLVQVNNLSINNSSHDQLSENIVLSIPIVLTIQNSNHFHSPVSYIMRMDHETGDLSDYTSENDPGNKINIVSEASLNNTSYGMKIEYYFSGNYYAEKVINANDSGELGVRFYFDPNSGYNVTSGKEFITFYNSSNEKILELVFWNISGIYYFRPFIYDNSGNPFFSSIIQLLDDQNVIEVYFNRSDHAYLCYFVNNDRKTYITSINNLTRFNNVNYVRVGDLSVTNVYNSFYVDEILVVNNLVRIDKSLNLSTQQFISINNSEHDQTSTTPLLNQIHNININNSEHSNLSTLLTLNQNHNLIIQNSEHNTLSEQINLTQQFVLTIQNSVHNHAVDSPLITKQSSLIPQNSEHNLITQIFNINQNHILINQNSEHLLSSTNILIIQVNIININSSQHSLTSDNILLIQINILSIQSSVHNQLVDNILIVQIHTLVNNNSSHDQLAGNVELVTTGLLNVQNSNHSHSVESFVLAQQHILIIQNSQNDLSSINIILVYNSSITLQDSSHTLESLNINIAQIHIINIINSIHTLISENILLIQINYLIVSNGLNFHSAEILTLAQNHILFSQDSEIDLLTELFGLSQQHSISVDYSTINLISENISIEVVEMTYLYAVEDISLGLWTDQNNGITNIFNAINETDPSDENYVKSPSIPNPNTYRFKLGNGSDPNVDYGHSIIVRYEKPDEADKNLTLKIRLYDGEILIAEWQDISQNTWNTTEHSLTEEQASSISDYANLFVELEAEEVI